MRYKHPGAVAGASPFPVAAEIAKPRAATKSKLTATKVIPPAAVAVAPVDVVQELRKSLRALEVENSQREARIAELRKEEGFHRRTIGQIEVLRPTIEQLSTQQQAAPLVAGAGG